MESDEKLVASEAREFTEAIVGTIKDPILVLDKDLKVYSANEAFYQFFKSNRNETIGRLVYDLGNGQWNIQELKKLLSDILPKENQIYGFEVTHKFEDIGVKTMLLNAKEISLSGGIKGILLAIEDITEHAEVRGLLSSFETRYRKLFESAIDGSLIVDGVSGTIIDVNQLLIDLLGYSHKEFLAKKIWNLGLFKDIVVNKAQFSRMQKEGVTKFENLSLETSKGKKLEVEFFSNTFNIENKKIIQCIIKDVTERKKAEVLLERSEIYLRATLNSTDDGILAIGNDGKIIQANKRFVEFWKIPDKLIKQNDDNVLLAYVLDQLIDPKAFIIKVKELYKSKETDFDVIYFKDGRVFERFSTPLIMSGEIEGRVWSFRDISQKVKDEREIIESKAKSEAILASIGDAVFASDKNGKILLFNKIAEEMTGITAKEAIGCDYRQVISFVKESDGKPSYDFIGEAIKNNTITKMTNHVLLVRKDGRAIPVADSAGPITDAKGEIVGCVVVFHDVTRERQVDKAKTEFVLLASHQLRTPLSTINWYSEMLLSGDAGKLTVKQRKYSTEVYHASQRMVSLINALLNVSRLELGTFAVEPENINIIKIAKSSIEDLNSIILKKNLIVLEKYDDTATMIKVDPRLIAMIFQNLLSNSVKYTRNGGKIELSISKKNGMLIISIKDNGIGIPRDEQGGVFEKLFRAENAKKLDPVGTGLGLYMVKEIIEYTGGKVWFESMEEKGSTFYVALPLTGMLKKAGNKNLI